ncbi:hypothetical protein CLS_14940 [[Clostridium] cf. saccharolyticum K10]|nr:hypothetical protein CLS_14940 [[Clostridium] cf. saccharolyticum K10]
MRGFTGASTKKDRKSYGFQPFCSISVYRPVFTRL